MSSYRPANTSPTRPTSHPARSTPTIEQVRQPPRPRHLHSYVAPALPPARHSRSCVAIRASTSPGAGRMEYVPTRPPPSLLRRSSSATLPPARHSRSCVAIRASTSPRATPMAQPHAAPLPLLRRQRREHLTRGYPHGAAPTRPPPSLLRRCGSGTLPPARGSVAPCATGLRVNNWLLAQASMLITQKRLPSGSARTMKSASSG